MACVHLTNIVLFSLKIYLFRVVRCLQMKGKCKLMHIAASLEREKCIITRTTVWKLCLSRDLSKAGKRHLLLLQQVHGSSDDSGTTTESSQEPYWWEQLVWASPVSGRLCIVLCNSKLQCLPKSLPTPLFTRCCWAVRFWAEGRWLEVQHMEWLWRKIGKRKSHPSLTSSLSTSSSTSNTWTASLSGLDTLLYGERIRISMEIVK